MRVSDLTSVAVPHDYIHVEAREKYHNIVFCRRCGYVAFYGNANDKSRDEMQRNLPPTCIGGDGA